MRLCTDRLAAQSDSSPDAGRLQDRCGLPEGVQGSDVLDLGPHEAAPAVLQLPRTIARGNDSRGYGSTRADEWKAAFQEKGWA